MTLIAGVDIGNTTTEVVVVRTGSVPPRPVAWDRAPTRGAKGSDSSLAGAVALVRRLERRLGARVDLLACAPLRPVQTVTATVDPRPPPTGRLSVVRVDGRTPGGHGVGAGVPVVATGPAHRVEGPVVLLVPAGTGYVAAVAAHRAFVAAGCDVRAVLVADDEGVLVASRLDRPLPVADQVDVATAATAVRLVVEIAPPGEPLATVVDPVRLSALLGLDDRERGDALALAAAVGDRSRAVVALHHAALPARQGDDGGLRLRVGAPGADRGGLAGAADGCADGVWSPWSTPLAERPVGVVDRYRLPGAEACDVDDLWVVGVREVAVSVAAPVDATTSRALVLAALTSSVTTVRPDTALADDLGAPALLLEDEAAAARVGALTTPGALPGSVVVDLGGGTVDVVAAHGAPVVAAGAGELLTAAVAAYLTLPRGAADWVKRGPCSRLEAPQLVLAEDGTRGFLERAAPAAAVGSLVAAGPAGMLAFGGATAPAQWRALRLRLKQRVLVDNVARAVRGADGAVSDLLLVGGAAADGELLALLRSVLPGVAAGRGDVAGVLGPRYAVAYGLALLASERV